MCQPGFPGACRPLSGAAFVLCLKAARRGRVEGGSSILAIPTSCFTGGWLTTLFEVDDILSAYVTSLAATSILVGAVLLYALVVSVTHELMADA